MEQLDLTPNPRVLAMLGNIQLSGWQCIAELMDNSLDALIHMPQNGDIVKRVEVQIPKEGDLKKGHKVIVRDTGPGMNQGQLQNALRAGYSGQDSRALGLFGMGFNISTNRLGQVVEVWTASREMDQEIGVRLDVGDMQRRDNFAVDLITRPKDKLAPSGTEIAISSFYPRSYGMLRRKNLKRALAACYTPELSAEHEVQLLLNGELLRPPKYCIWDSSRFVKHKDKKVFAEERFSENLGSKWFCEKCLQWSETQTERKSKCSRCDSAKHVIRQDLEITGWFGVQRYHHGDDYGVNFVRNGRVILRKDKGLFTWENRGRFADVEDSILEYPIDSPGYGGRIVGEVHVDFLVPTYTKDSFEQDDLWYQVVDKLRGVVPMQPKVAASLRAGENSSPLARLWNGFRKSYPAGPKTLVIPNKSGAAAITWAKDLSHLFYAGDDEWQDETRWFELVLGSADPDEDAEDDSDDFAPPPNDDNSDGDDNPVKDDRSLLSEREFKLSRKYGRDGLKCRIYAVQRGETHLIPISRRKQGGYWELEVNQDVIPLSGTDLDDLIFAELANIWFGTSTDAQGLSLSGMIIDLRDQYAAASYGTSGDLREAIREFFTDVVSDDRFSAIEIDLDIDDKDKEIMRKKMADGKALEVILRTTRRMKYSTIQDILAIGSRYPAVFLNGECFRLALAETPEGWVDRKLGNCWGSLFADLLVFYNARDIDALLESFIFKEKAAQSLTLLKSLRI